MRGAAYSANITDEVSRVPGKARVAGIHIHISGPARTQGLIEARVTDAKTEPELKGRRYFTATLPGEHALAEAKERSSIVADFLGDFA